MTIKPVAEACERNRDPILEALLPRLANARGVLEIGSGTGQHAVYFAAAMPWLQWQCSDHPEHLPGMQLWLDEAALANVPKPWPLQAVPGIGLSPPPKAARFDAVFTANTLHIMAWDSVQEVFAALPAIVTPGGLFISYGPFNRDGAFTSDSNRAFDAWLRERNPQSGIRDRDALKALAQRHGVQLVEDIAMPANNALLVWRCP